MYRPSSGAWRLASDAVADGARKNEFVSRNRVSAPGSSPAEALEHRPEQVLPAQHPVGQRSKPASCCAWTSAAWSRSTCSSTASGVVRPHRGRESPGRALQSADRCGGRRARRLTLAGRVAYYRRTMRRFAAWFSSTVEAYAAVLGNANLRRSQLAWGAAMTAEWAFFVGLGVFAFSEAGTLGVGLVGYPHAAVGGRRPLRLAAR